MIKIGEAQTTPYVFLITPPFSKYYHSEKGGIVQTGEINMI